MKILVTGFVPFDGDSVNPSQTLLTWLTTRPLPFELHTQLLPVTFDSGRRILEEAIARVNPQVVVCTGLAKNRAEITVERIGINWVDARIPDNDGVTLKAQKIIEEGADGLFTRLPIAEMLKASHDIGVPARLSTTAGEYVCNYILYCVLQRFPQLPAGFIHLPLDPQFEGVEEMLKVCYHHFIMNK